MFWYKLDDQIFAKLGQVIRNVLERQVAGNGQMVNQGQGIAPCRRDLARSRICVRGWPSRPPGLGLARSRTSGSTFCSPSSIQALKRISTACRVDIESQRLGLFAAGQPAKHTRVRAQVPNRARTCAFQKSRDRPPFLCKVLRAVRVVVIVIRPMTAASPAEPAYGFFEAVD